MANAPFDALDSAHEYIRLLASQVREVQQEITSDCAEASASGQDRRIEALRLVDFKLLQLGTHLAASQGILNDLRMLRRVLVHDDVGFKKMSSQTTARVHQNGA